MDPQKPYLEPPKFAQQRPKTFLKSKNGHYFTYFWGPGNAMMVITLKGTIGFDDFWATFVHGDGQSLGLQIA